MQRKKIEFPLGRRIYSSGFALHGTMTDKQWMAFLVDIARAIGMNPVSKPACWEYPVNEQGGTGLTIIQPITESFLALDTWPDHKGAYLFIVSCRCFDLDAIEIPLIAFGLDLIGETGRHGLALP